MRKAKPAPVNARIVVTGPEEKVYDYTSMHCAEWDVPDISAFAVRSVDGTVRLNISHEFTRRMTGPDLNHVTHDCTIALASQKNRDPSAYADGEWLGPMWTDDGQTVYALVHEEYHADQYGVCSYPFPAPNFSCSQWSVTAAVSHDGGRTFQQGPAPELFVATKPERYRRDQPIASSGIGQPINIVRHRDGFYYTFVGVNDEPWYSGPCLMRTRNLAQPRSWRAWGGTGFTVAFVDPYRDAVGDPAAHRCHWLEDVYLKIRFGPASLTWNVYLQRYVLVGLGDGDQGWGFYFSTSPDLLHWTAQRLIAAHPRSTGLCSAESVGNPSVIDPQSRSRSFDTAGKQAYLYYTRFGDTCPPVYSDRDLVRVPIAFSK